jgi:hypothetical protein
VSQAMSPSAMKPYGILGGCPARRLCRAAVQRHNALTHAWLRIPLKRGPFTRCTAGEENGGAET